MQLESHGQVRGIVNGVFRRAISGILDSRRGGIESASRNLSKRGGGVSREGKEGADRTHLIGLRKREIVPLLGDSLVLLNEVRDARQGNRDVQRNRSATVQFRGGETLETREKQGIKRKEEVAASVRRRARLR
jgi:hypothetical protein